MKLSDVSLLDLIPESMRTDRFIRGFAAAWDYLMSQALSALPIINLYDNLDLLTPEQLDKVADAMRIPWYNTEYEKEKKIALIKHYEQTCFELGTVKSIETVCVDIYEKAEVYEWYEYGGDPFYFKVSLDYGDYTTEEALSRLERIVRDIKPAKANLNMEFLETAHGNLYTGAAVSTCYHFPDITEEFSAETTQYSAAVITSLYTAPDIIDADIT